MGGRGAGKERTKLMEPWVKENWPMLVSILSGFRAPFHTLRLLVGGREDGRGYGAFGGPGKRGGNKKEPLDLVRWIVRDAGEREGWLGFKAPSPPPRLLVGGREDGR